MPKVFAIAVVIAAVLAGPASAASSKARPWYIRPDQMEAQLEEYGLTWNHRNHAVLEANCVGQGKPGRKTRDEAGLAWPTYHLFGCAVTVRRVPDLQLIHVETHGRGHWSWEEI